MNRALLLGDELGVHAIAIPALGTGRARVNVETCARAMSSALVWYLALGGSRLKKVRLVLSSEEKRRVFRDVIDDVMHDDADDPPVDVGLAVDDGAVRVDAATHLDTRPKR
jgi:serine/threonine-protein kinase